MLTRLRIDGFKNLVDVDLRFGPFTCLAGANGVGKSNVFDAIVFLGSLADATFVEAAAAVRADGDDGGDMLELMFRSGDHVRDRMRFVCDLLVPRDAEDDLGQPAIATSTFLRYTLELGYVADEMVQGGNRLSLLHEELVHINTSEARRDALPFVDNKGGKWFESVFVQDRTGGPFISMTEDEEGRIVQLHQDGRSQDKKRRRGRQVPFRADRLPRTVLSSVSASESPTALVARREMRSWRRLQLEGSALRRSDRFDAPGTIATDGAHMPKTLRDLQMRSERMKTPLTITDELVARLSELVDDVRGLELDVDEARRRLTLVAQGSDGTRRPARAMSDGTLRFLALAIIEQTRQSEVLCLEEPENGIHPSRIAAILRLLMDIAIDPDYPVDDDNPLRQVIVNTHSPGFVRACPKEALIVVDVVERVDVPSGRRAGTARFRALPGTWRQALNDRVQPVFMAELLRFLESVPIIESSVPDDPVGDYVADQLMLAID